METEHTKVEIERQRDEATAMMTESQTQFPHSSYEDGVAAALDWILGEESDGPMD